MYDKKVVVNCVLAPVEEQNLQISFNAKTGSGRFDVPSDADARLFCDETEVGRFVRNGVSGKWTLPHTPVPGGRYKLVVSVPGWDVITAETRYPDSSPPVQRTKGDSSRERTFIQSETFSPYWIFVMNQPVESAYTMMRYPAATDNDRLVEHTGTDHPGVDGFNAQSRPVMVEYGVEGKTISQYVYLRICPAEVSYPLSFTLESSGLFPSLVYFRSVSDEYDKYLKTSLQKVLAVHSEDDPTYWFDEGKVFCNIDGGLGIFGAYDDYVIQINWKTDFYFNQGIPYDEWPFDM